MSCFREDIGLGIDFFNSIKKHIPSIDESKASIRKLITIVGMDNSVSHDAFAKNVGPIVEYDPKKGTTLKPGVVVRVTRGGMEEYYMTRRAVETSRTFPTHLVRVGSGEGVMESPDWVRIGKNVTIDPKTNTLRTFSPEVIDGKTYYRESRPGDEDVVFLNIHRPVDVDGLPVEQLLKDQIDGYQVKFGDTEYFRPVSRHQVVVPSGYDKMTGRMDVYDSTKDFDMVKDADELLAEADKPMSWYQGHGLLGPAAGAFIGNVMDNMGDEDDENTLMYLGAVLGSRRTRGVLKKTYNKFVPTRSDGMTRINPDLKRTIDTLPVRGDIPAESLEKIAKGYGIDSEDFKSMVRVSKDIFNLENQKAVAASVLMDRMVMNMAKRDGISKAEMYRKINFKKSTLESLPEDVKFQMDLISAYQPKLKIHEAYDQAPMRIKEAFNGFDFAKFGTGAAVTQEEQAMLNWFKKKGMSNEDFEILKNTGLEDYEIDQMIDYFGYPMSKNEAILESFNLGEFNFLTFDNPLLQPNGIKINRYSSDLSNLEGAIPAQGAKQSQIIALSMEPKGIDVVFPKTFDPEFVHTFKAGKGKEEIKSPAWARFQIKQTDEGLAMFIDEVQIENILQKNNFGPIGSLNKDLYTTVLDELFVEAQRNGIDKIYLSAGAQQEIRYYESVLPKDITATTADKFKKINKAIEFNRESTRVDELFDEVTPKTKELQDAFDKWKERRAQGTDLEKKFDELYDKNRNKNDYIFNRNNLSNEERQILNSFEFENDLEKDFWLDKTISETTFKFSLGGIFKDFNFFSSKNLKNFESDISETELEFLKDPKLSGKVERGIKERFLKKLKNDLETSIISSNKISLETNRIESDFSVISRVFDEINQVVDAVVSGMERQGIIDTLFDDAIKAAELKYDYDKLTSIDDLVDTIKSATLKEFNETTKLNFGSYDAMAERVLKGGTNRGLYQFYDQELPKLIKSRYGFETRLAKEGPVGSTELPLGEAFHEIDVKNWEGFDEVYGTASQRLLLQKALLFQRDAAGIARGAASVELDGRATIFALTDPNVSTPLHEMAHVFEHYLTDAERLVFLKESGSSEWDRTTSELFARGFEKFLADGLAPTPELQSLFTRFKSWMLDIYRTLVGSEIDIKLNDEMRRVYSEMLRNDPTKDAITPEMRSVIDADFTRRKEFEAFTGTKTYTTDPAERVERINFWQSLKQTIREGGSVWDFISANSYTQSAWKHLTNFGDAAVAKRLIDGLMNLNNTISMYRGKPAGYFAQLNEGGIGALKEYKERGIVENVREALGADKGYSEEELAKIGNSAANRILQTGAVLDVDGKLIYYSHMTNVKEVYEGAFGDEILDLDSKLLQIDAFRNYVESYRLFYRSMANDYIEQMSRRLDKIIANPALTEIERQALRNFAATNASIHNYLKELKQLADEVEIPEVRSAYKAEYDALSELAVRNRSRDRNFQFKLFEEFVEYHEGMARVRNMDMKYLPQMVSKRKIEAARTKFYEENGLLDAPRDKRQEMFNQYMFERFLEVNIEDPKARRAILQHDPTTGTFERRKFRSYDEAKQAIIDAMERVDGIPAELKERTLTDVDRFILSEVKGTKKPRTVYYVSTPSDYEINPFMYKYRADFKDFSRYINEGAFIANSNFLDNPRTRVVPVEFLEDDLDAIMNRYSFDAGRKIHNMKYDMLNIKELKMNYIDPLSAEYDRKYSGNPRMLRKGREAVNRMESIFNAVNGTHNMTGAELDRFIKNSKIVDTIRNVYQARFGYGFGFYNMFEWAAVGPLITSFDSVKGVFKHYATNKEALEARIQSLKEIGVGNRMIQSLNRDMEDPTMIAESMVDKASGVTGKVADKIMDFSVSKSLAKMMNLDVEEGGIWRLMFDSFDGSNIVSTAVVAQSAIVEANSLAKILNKMPADGILREGGVTYTRGDVVRQLENLGIPAAEVDNFARVQERFAEVIEATDANRLHDLDFLEEHREAFDFSNRILRNTVDTMHGTNRLMRPEGLLSPGGKLLAMYSTYPFNFAVQHVQRRIRQPLNDWFGKHEGKSLGTAMLDTSLLRIMWAYNTGNTAWLRSRGFSQEAIEEFPVDAAIQIGRMFGSMGISIGGLMSLAVIKDVISYPINEMNEQEQWLATRRMVTINQNAPESEQYTWGDLDRDFGVPQFMDMTTYFLGLVARTGAAGRYGDIAMNPWILRRDGPMGITPVTGDFSRLVTDTMQIFDAEPAQWPTELTSVMGKKLFEFAPLINSSMLTPARKGMLQYVQDEYGFFATDTETGRQIKMEDLVDM